MVYSYNSYFNSNYYNTTAVKNDRRSGRVSSVAVKSDAAVHPSKSKVYNKMTSVPFNPAFSASDLRTRLISNDEKNKYNTLQKVLDRKGKKELDILLKNGTLLNADSADKSTVLDNLYKIVSVKRADGLNASSLAKDVIVALANPYTITQQFGDIPAGYKNSVVNTYMSEKNLDQNNQNMRHNSENEVNVTHSGTCVAASIEFNLAKKSPAEFARFAEGLTSENVAVEKEIHLDKLADNTLDAVWLLNAFEVPYKMDNFNTAKLTFKPDKDAIIRARIQTTNKDEGERSPVDVLMQSTFMQLGSQQSYNSLTDKRAGKFNQNDKGLIEFEKTFVETIVNNESKISLTYQIVDDNQRIVGYNYDFNAVQKQLIDSLNGGSDVIIGITEADESNRIIGGHEITVIGYQQDADGKVVFTVNDTDDDTNMPITVSASELIPKIHHAGIPTKLVNLPPQEEIGYQILQEYNNFLNRILG